MATPTPISCSVRSVSEIAGTSSTKAFSVTSTVSARAGTSQISSAEVIWSSSGRSTKANGDTFTEQVTRG